MLSGYTQVVTPNPHIPCEPGWCLMYVRQAFGLPARYKSATEAWFASTSKHTDRNYPKGVWFAIWWGLDTNVNGHVALVAPDGSVFSTSSLAKTPYHHPNIAHVEAYYARYGMTLTYRGWTEDVASYRVIAPVQEEDDLLATKEQREELIKELLGTPIPQHGGGFNTLYDLISEHRSQHLDLVKGIGAVPKAVLDTPVEWAGLDGKGPNESRKTTTLALQTGWADAHVSAILGQNAALRELVEQLAVKQGVVIDYEKIAKAVNDDAAKRLQE